MVVCSGEDGHRYLLVRDREPVYSVLLNVLMNDSWVPR
jgi:hypothetical protein